MVIIYCCWGEHLKKRTMRIGIYLAISFFLLVLFIYFSFFFSLFFFSFPLFPLFYFFCQPLGGGGGDRPHRPPPLRSATAIGTRECTKIIRNLRFQSTILNFVFSSESSLIHYAAYAQALEIWEIPYHFGNLINLRTIDCLFTIALLCCFYQTLMCRFRQWRS